jgi:hypothetical protein
MVKVLALIGGGALVTGTGFFLWMKKRKFDRTNSVGVEQFESYSRKLAATFLDRCLGGLSAIFLIGGTVFLAYGFEDSWGWIVLLPLYFVLLIGIW